MYATFDRVARLLARLTLCLTAGCARRLRSFGAVAILSVALSAALTSGCALMAAPAGSPAPILLPLPARPALRFMAAETEEGIVICLSPPDTKKLGVFLLQFDEFRGAYERLKTPLPEPK